MMRIRKTLFVALLALLSTAAAALEAEPDAAAKLEVDQLLTRLAASGCQFQRNGAWHNATDARAHLERKYRYLLDRRLVGSAGDFISLAATKSSTSGKEYLVKCGAHEQVSSAAWMNDQLREIRATAREASTRTN